MEKKIKVPARVVRAMYGIQEYCKGRDNCDCELPQCLGMGDMPERWGIRPEDIKRWEMKEHAE